MIHMIQGELKLRIVGNYNSDENITDITYFEVEDWFRTSDGTHSCNRYRTNAEGVIALGIMELVKLLRGKKS